MSVSRCHTFRFQSNPPTGGTPCLMANTYSKESSLIASIEGHTADWRLRAMRSSRGSSQPKTTIVESLSSWQRNSTQKIHNGTMLYLQMLSSDSPDRSGRFCMAEKSASSAYCILRISVNYFSQT